MWSTALALFLGTPAHADGPDREVRQTLEAWVQATDERDAEAVEAMFQPHAVQLVKLGDKQMSLPAEAYVGMIRDGKLGGGKTKLSVRTVSVTGQLAVAHTTRKGGELLMNDAIVLERTADGWRIASAVVHASPR